MNLPLSFTAAAQADLKHMRTRMLATLGGGVAGFLIPFALPIGSALGLAPGWTEAVCMLVGSAVGYVGTCLLDVFLTSPE